MIIFMSISNLYFLQRIHIMKRRRKQVLTNHNALLVLFWIWRSTTLETAGSLVVEGKRRSTTTTSRLQRKRKTLISSDQGKKQRGLIIGGEEAVSGDYPYFVHYKKPGCGGSLIAPDIVLTAAHCQQDWVSQYGKLYVGRYERTGGRTTESFSVLSQSVHPMFDGQVCCGKSGDNWFYGVHNDFMLLKLNGQSTTTKPIKLNQSPMRPQQGDELHVIGFGDIDQGQDFVEPDKLHHVTVNYMTNAQCVANSVYTSDLLTLMSMCASDRGEDACSGDSGGPLIAKGATDEDDVLMGVVSWGWDCAVEPGVYARVSAGYSWIREEVCKMSDNPPASFRCPAPPSPPPTSTPTSTPTKSPTLAPTSRPTTPSPTFMPTRSPTTNPTDLPTEEPTVRPTTSHPTPTPTTDAPSRYPSLDPTNTSTSDAPSIISIDTTQQFLQDLQADILWERQQPIVMERTRLSADTQCQDIMDPLVCCAARQTHNDTVCETANVVMDEDGLWTRSPSMTCVSREDNAFRAPGAGVEIEISSHGGVLPSQQQDLLLSKDNTCESILEQHVRRRSTINECSSLISRRSCCSAVDSNGQPCVPILAVAVGDGDQAGGDRCAPMDWIVSNFATARLVECSLRDRQSP